MIVVADTGPLHYLILLEHAELLHRFYGEVVVPERHWPSACSSSFARPEPGARQSLYRCPTLFRKDETVVRGTAGTPDGPSFN